MMEAIDGTLMEYLMSRGTYAVTSRNEGRGYAFTQWKVRKEQDTADWTRHHSGQPAIRMESNVTTAPAAAVSESEDRDARRCKVCGTYGFQGALFTTLGGQGICNDCA